MKTANQIWRESGRQMPFKDFIESRRKQEFYSADGVENFMYNKPVNDSIQQTLKAMQNKGSGVKESLTKKTILGVPTPYFYVGVTVIVVAIVYYQVQKSK